MSLYNKLFGENKLADTLLDMINCTRDDFKRYRDIYLNKAGTIITVVTRAGGNNREIYKEVFNNIRKNNLYRRDFDDEVDNTYAYIQFKVPEKYIGTCRFIAPKKEPLSVSQKFLNALEEAKNPDTEISKTIEELANEIIKKIENGDKFIYFE